VGCVLKNFIPVGPWRNDAEVGERAIILITADHGHVARRAFEHPGCMLIEHTMEEAAHSRPKSVKNYITPGGFQRLRDERRFLLIRERPAVTQVVAWAASNGDRSENADYQYNKRRLREIDRRIRFLSKRIDAAEVVDPAAPRQGRAATQVFFGATVRYANAAGTERVVSVVGVDEVDLDRNHISWVSPLARVLMNSGPGDCVVLHAPGGTERLQILDVRYERIPVKPFTEPPGAESAPKARPGARLPARS
jgi:transcription elongation factor GreB